MNSPFSLHYVIDCYVEIACETFANNQDEAAIADAVLKILVAFGLVRRERNTQELTLTQIGVDSWNCGIHLRGLKSVLKQSIRENETIPVAGSLQLVIEEVACVYSKIELPRPVCDGVSLMV